MNPGALNPDALNPDALNPDALNPGLDVTTTSPEACNQAVGRRSTLPLILPLPGGAHLLDFALETPQP
jgi:hypothetical protein